MFNIEIKEIYLFALLKSKKKSRTEQELEQFLYSLKNQTIELLRDKEKDSTNLSIV